MKRSWLRKPSNKEMFVLLLGLVFMATAYLFPPVLWQIESGPRAPALDIAYRARFSSMQYSDKSVKTGPGSVIDLLTLAEEVLILVATSVLFCTASNKRRKE